MAIDVRMQNVFEKNPGLIDHGVATGVTQFHMVTSGLILRKNFYTKHFSI